MTDREEAINREASYNAAIAVETYRAMTTWREHNKNPQDGSFFVLCASLSYLKRLRQEREHPPYVPEDLSKVRY